MLGLMSTPLTKLLNRTSVAQHGNRVWESSQSSNSIDLCLVDGSRNSGTQAEILPLGGMWELYVEVVCGQGGHGSGFVCDHVNKKWPFHAWPRYKGPKWRIDVSIGMDHGFVFVTEVICCQDRHQDRYY